MAKDAPPKPWDRRPWPITGDARRSVAEKIGEALSTWEGLELEMSLLFAKMVGGRFPTPARRAFSAVRTFQGRLEMVQAASLAYFEIAQERCDKAAVEKCLPLFKDVFRLSKSYSERRNDVAHGTIMPYMKSPEAWEDRDDDVYALYPSFASFKERSTEHIPTYCMNSQDIAYFTGEFYKVSSSIMILTSMLPSLPR